MKAIKRIVGLLAESAAHEAYAGSLSPGSPVAIAELKVFVLNEQMVTAVDAGGISVDDGRTYTDKGHCDEKYSSCRFIVEPHEVSRETCVERLLVKELREFPWKALTVEGLDAALKYAKFKYLNSSKKKTKEALKGIA